MAQIDIDPDALRAGARGQSAVAAGFDAAADVLGSVASKLDWEFDGAQHVEAMIRRLERSLRGSGRSASDHATYLTFVADTFERAEATLVRDVRGLEKTESAPKSATAAEMKASDQRMQEELRRIIAEKYTEKQWDRLKTQEAREEFLDSLGREIAKVMGIEYIPVAFEKMKFGQNGYYDPTSDRIAINVDHADETTLETFLGGPLHWFEGDTDYEQCIATLSHEYRHAYQDAQMKTGGYPVDQATTEAWIENNNDYKSTSSGASFKEYWEQPLEVDARGFSSGILKAPESHTLG